MQTRNYFEEARYYETTLEDMAKQRVDETTEAWLKRVNGWQAGERKLRFLSFLSLYAGVGSPAALDLENTVFLLDYQFKRGEEEEVLKIYDKPYEQMLVELKQWVDRHRMSK